MRHRKKSCGASGNRIEVRLRSTGLLNTLTCAFPHEWYDYDPEQRKSYGTRFGGGRHKVEGQIACAERRRCGIYRRLLRFICRDINNDECIDA